MKSAVKKFKGLSDKAIAWIFIAPTLILLLAICFDFGSNQFPTTA